MQTIISIVQDLFCLAKKFNSYVKYLFPSIYTSKNLSESIFEQFETDEINVFSVGLHYFFYRFLSANQKENFECIYCHSCTKISQVFIFYLQVILWMFFNMRYHVLSEFFVDENLDNVSEDTLFQM